MPFDIKATKRRLARCRAALSFYLVATAQFLSPAAAADPASKIDPPAWAHTHTQKEIQAFGTRATAREPEKKDRQNLNQARLRRRIFLHSVRKVF